MTKNPLVSVVVAAYNEETNIERLLRSVKRQTYNSVESIVVDDESTDRTSIIAKKFADKVFVRKHNERSVQRNFGVSKASGKYVLVIDADMELSPDVIKSCIDNLNGHKALIVPEQTVGDSFMAKIRRFEREMYMGDLGVEVARFFDREVFLEFDGYDPDLTGPEDYDLPYRISKKYSIGWAKKYIYHHEKQLTLAKQLKKKFYYAAHGAKYARKHPELILRQGILILRPAYLKHWKKFFRFPLVGMLFLCIRVLETLAAGLGFMWAIIFK